MLGTISTLFNLFPFESYATNSTLSISYVPASLKFCLAKSINAFTEAISARASLPPFTTTSVLFKETDLTLNLLSRAFILSKSYVNDLT